MREELLHFIWQHRYFNHQALFTEAGEPLQVLSPGTKQPDQGPDFRDARIRIGDRIVEGPVEIHVLASDWVRHSHDSDVHYRETILHVVWVNDWRAGAGKPSTPGDVPILTLEQRVPKLLLSRYERWMTSPAFVPCERQLPRIDGMLWTAWRRELVLQRLQRRALLIRDILREYQQHWEAVAWIMVARSMGQTVNATAFEAIARSLPVGWLARARWQPLQLEALLLGQAGLFEKPTTDEYMSELQREYRHHQAKWGLAPVNVPLSFLRMRPGHFPTIRLAQLAGLLAGTTSWLARVREAGDWRELVAGLSAEAGGYWQTHYLPGRPTADKGPRRLGAETQRGLVINAFVPLLFAYGALRSDPASQDKAIRWLDEMPAEKNVLLGRWAQLGVSARTAADGQALMELKKRFCLGRQCLECAIGQHLLRQEQEHSS